jgi:hypothetical protein
LTTPTGLHTPGVRTGPCCRHRRAMTTKSRLPRIVSRSSHATRMPPRQRKREPRYTSVTTQPTNTTTRLAAIKAQNRRSEPNSSLVLTTVETGSFGSELQPVAGVGLPRRSARRSSRSPRRRVAGRTRRDRSRRVGARIGLSAAEPGSNQRVWCAVERNQRQYPFNPGAAVCCGGFLGHQTLERESASRGYGCVFRRCRRHGCVTRGMPAPAG